MNAMDQRCDHRNSVLERLVVTDGEGSARLAVDQAHPFFFDHPLDHVPGLLLLEGAVQIAQALAASSGFIARLEAQFVKYALFDAPIDLEARAGRRGRRTRVDASVIQKGTVRARLKADIEPRPARPIQTSPVPGLPPCPAALLNKQQPENVLISEPRIEGEKLVASTLAPDRRCLIADSSIVTHPLHLLEAFMQTQRWLNHQRPSEGRMRDILLGVALAQRAPLARNAGATLIGQRTETIRDRRIAVRTACAFAGRTRAALLGITTARLDVGHGAT